MNGFCLSIIFCLLNLIISHLYISSDITVENQTQILFVHSVHAQATRRICKTNSNNILQLLLLPKIVCSKYCHTLVHVLFFCDHLHVSDVAQ